MGIGIFAGRKNRPIRIGWLLPVLKALELNRHFRIDDKIIDLLSTQHASIGKKVLVHFDISEKVVHFQGIELYSNEYRNWDLVYEALAKHSLAVPELKSRILAWSDAYFGNIEIAESATKGGRETSSYPKFCHCGINHFKLVNNDNLSVKVYHNVGFIGKTLHSARYAENPS